MKFFTIALLLIPPAFAQMTNLPCVPPPAAPSPANAAGQGRGRGPGTPRTPPQQSAADVAEIARLTSLPPWGQNLADGDYSNGPAYPTAPELAKRAGVPEPCSLLLFLSLVSRRVMRLPFASYVEAVACRRNERDRAALASRTVACSRIIPGGARPVPCVR
jgi:hypothetical protein